ncbi:MAG: hypothetical protein ACT4PV_14770 [Planctomycetaceae bacterium]
MNERRWVETMVPWLRRGLARMAPRGGELVIETGKRLPYRYEVNEYAGDQPHAPVPAEYETDLLIYDREREDRWTPRVVVECKLGKVSTHDALTYSAKAATHKQVHPCLRYGILIGDQAHRAIPGRLVRHGAHFDFMATWIARAPRTVERRALLRVLADEVRASRQLQEILGSSRQPDRTRYKVIHRPLRLVRVNRGTPFREEEERD